MPFSWKTKILEQMSKIAENKRPLRLIKVEGFELCSGWRHLVGRDFRDGLCGRSLRGLWCGFVFGSLFWVHFLLLVLGQAWATSVFVWNRLGKAWFVFVSSGKFWEGVVVAVCRASMFKAVKGCGVQVSF